MYDIIYTTRRMLTSSMEDRGFETGYWNNMSSGRHVAPLVHIILILSRPVFALFPQCCMLSGEATNTNISLWYDSTSALWILTSAFFHCVYDIMVTIYIYIFTYFKPSNRISGIMVSVLTLSMNFMAWLEYVSEWLLLNANSAIFQLYHGKNKLVFNEIMMRFVLF
jgi:hypothetical protein